MVFTDGTTGLSNGASHHHEPDDISLILLQLLRRSSSSSSSTPMMHPSSFPPVAPHAGDHYLPCFSSLPGSQPDVFSGSDRLVVDRISDETPLGSGAVLSSPSGYFPACGETNILSSESLTGSVQTTTLELDHEYPEEGDCESEEGPDPVVGEAENNNQQPSRSQSKRSRAAEVHNLSEKRRRSRINEKMKALQNLIPNSNKTDKASMLDEAIEYLKQLQLQVQMLSMRNGLSLHPMCLPGVPSAMHPAQLSQMGIDLGHQGGTIDTNLTDTINMTTSDTNFILPKQCAPSARPSLPGVSTIINSEAASFGLESCIQSNFGSFGIRDHISNLKIVDRDQSRFQDHFAMNNNETKSLVTTAPCLFETRESDMRDHNPLEGHTEGRYGSEEILMENIPVKNQLTASNLSGYN